MALGGQVCQLLESPRPQCCQSMLPRSEMPGWNTFGNLSAIIFPEHASKVSGWEAFRKPIAITLPQYASQTPRLGSVEKLEAIILLEHASETPGWEVLRNSRPSYSRACLRDVMFRFFWETQSHIVAKACLRDVRLGNSLQSQGNHIQSVPPPWQAGTLLGNARP